MSLKQLFRDELEFLRHEGKEFSRQNPGLSRFLSEKSTDPDIERLLEGFAFLSARLRHKIEDDFPEFTHSLLNLLWPNYLRPVPSMTIVQFSPVDNTISDKKLIPRGTPLDSKPVDDTQCRFKTCQDVPIYPFNLESVDNTESREKGVVGLNMKTNTEQPLSGIGCDHLPIHLAGDDYTAQTLYLWMFNYLECINIIAEGRVIASLSPKNIKRIGFAPEDALLPYPDNVFDGYRILQEYLAFPQRFYFFAVTGLENAWPEFSTHYFRLEFRYSRPFPEDISISHDSFALHCTPAVNLFRHDADPVRFDGKSTEYAVRPSDQNLDHYEVFSIDRVKGWSLNEDQNQDIARVYKPFESFDHEVERTKGNKTLYFRSNIREATAKPGFDRSIAFVREDETQLIPDDQETVSIEMTCSNRNLPEALAVGDIETHTELTPSYVNFKNITRPTPSLRPLLNSKLHWQLISNMSLNYMSLLELGPLRNIIASYGFKANENQQAKRYLQQRLASLRSIKTEATDILIKGMPIRGLKSEIAVDPTDFLCEGELYLFGTVLSHFFSLYSSINAFHALDIVNINNSEVFTWPLQKGHRPII